MAARGRRSGGGAGEPPAVDGRAAAVAAALEDMPSFGVAIYRSCVAAAGSGTNASLLRQQLGVAHSGLAVSPSDAAGTPSLSMVLPPGEDGARPQRFILCKDDPAQVQWLVGALARPLPAVEELLFVQQGAKPALRAVPAAVLLRLEALQAQWNAAAATTCTKWNYRR